MIWWGAPEGEIDTVERLLRAGPNVVPCAFDVDLSDLGDVCKSLLHG